MQTTRGAVVKYSPYAGFGFQAFGSRRYAFLSDKGLCWTREEIPEHKMHGASTVIKGLPYAHMRRVAVIATWRRRHVFAVDFIDPSRVHGEMLRYVFRVGTRFELYQWTRALRTILQPSAAAASVDVLHMPRQLMSPDSPSKLWSRRWQPPPPELALMKRRSGSSSRISPTKSRAVALRGRVPLYESTES